MSEQINNVLIVGGGTAGWITAAKLAKELNSNSPDGVQVTLIESPDIPTLGVGEGTWPSMRVTLQKLGIDETEFLRNCNATFKQGSKFVNWRTPQKDGVNNHYYNHFTSIHNPDTFNLAPYWKLGHAGNIPYSEAVSFQGSLCEAGLAPKKIIHAQYEGVQNYAYHLDAVKFAEMLKNYCINSLGVTHILGNLTNVLIDDSGFIKSIDTDVQGELAAGLFVDCSGSSALLIGKALNIGIHDISHQLFVDHAVAIQINYEDEQNDPIPTHTISTAQESGWIWDIALTNRRGTGHVYSSQYTDHDTAELALRNYLGPRSKDLTARKIKLNIGKRQKIWHKNCVSIGMSAAFIEPLEASAIFLIEAAGNMLADQFPRTRDELALVERKFNKSFDFRWEKSVDFIKMHYYLSHRNDSDFWRDNKMKSSTPNSLLEKLEHWRKHPLSRYDFDNIFEPFPLESYQYILYGLNFDLDIQNHQASYHMIEEAKKQFHKVKMSANLVANELPKHRDLLNKLRTHKFQTI